MRSNTHYKITNKLLKGIPWTDAFKKDVLKGARDADTMLQLMTLGHYYNAIFNFGGGLDNILKEVKGFSPTNIGIVLHIAQDAATPSHAEVVPTLTHYMWEGYIDRHIDDILSQVNLDGKLEGDLDIRELYLKVANHSLGLLNDMLIDWDKDRDKKFRCHCVECVQLSVDASNYIIHEADNIFVI